jgi:formylglycine-generating enzyme required for sulfatase activity
MDFALLPAGEFLMGAPDTDPHAQDNEKPQHRVRITRPFYLGTTEVARGQFRRFVDAAVYQTSAEKDGQGAWGWNGEKKTWEQGPKYTWQNPGFEQTDDHPVVNVTWNDAMAFADWLSRKERQTYRLPTEAEWEYAATGGDGREYPWGDLWDPQKANTAEAGPLITTPIGMYPSGRSPSGLCDMAGNVEEYVADSYEPYPGGEIIEDHLWAAHQGKYRITRGGSFSRYGDLARCARRHGRFPEEIYAVGFRLAESAEP